MRCIVKGCGNHKYQGRFIGDLCVPCYNYLTTGKIGITDSFLGRLTEIPEGYVLVPIEPTAKMLDSGEDTFAPCYTGTPVSDPYSVWSAMIKCTPKFRRV